MRRRLFLQTTAAAAGRSWLHRASSILAAGSAPAVLAEGAVRPAVLGGRPVHTGGWSAWPQWREEWGERILAVYRSGKWFRGAGDGVIAEFEEAYARTDWSKYRSMPAPRSASRPRAARRPS